ncbi:hypothetical protein AB6A40_007403 [Gnathostoma spinigerum]|uniref:Uncharacterized protein n=1 Tax=Gnathostoma spinigerum TaxID=75299 RepID=A0ABD6ER98_9BILA
MYALSVFIHSLSYLNTTLADMSFCRLHSIAQVICYNIPYNPYGSSTHNGKFVRQSLKLPEKRRGKRKTLSASVIEQGLMTPEQLEALKEELRQEEALKSRRK